MAAIKTRDAQAELGGAIRTDVQSAAGNNDKVSNVEARKLRPFLKDAYAELRGENPGQSITIDQVVDRAMQKAMAVWNRFNPPGGQNGLYLSAAEVKRIALADPDLGALTKAAYVAAGALQPGGGVEAMKRYIEQTPGVGNNFHGDQALGERLDVRPGQPARAEIPPKVLEGYDAFWPAEEHDWATASLRKMKLAGQDVWALHLFTDGDPGFLELYTRAGEPIASGRLMADDFQRWDESFGLGRYTGTLGTYAHVIKEGFSEDLDRQAAGQILSTWQPDATIASGTVLHDNQGVTGIDTNAVLTPDQRQAAMISLDLLFARTFEARLDPQNQTIALGPQAEGSLRLGTHTDPRDGKQYIVADWKDIDDASYTFYFTKPPSGALKLEIETTNG